MSKHSQSATPNPYNYARGYRYYMRDGIFCCTCAVQKLWQNLHLQSLDAHKCIDLQNVPARDFLTAPS